MANLECPKDALWVNFKQINIITNFFRHKSSKPFWNINKLNYCDELLHFTCPHIPFGNFQRCGILLAYLALSKPPLLTPEHPAALCLRLWAPDYRCVDRRQMGPGFCLWYRCFLAGAVTLGSYWETWRLTARRTADRLITMTDGAPLRSDPISLHGASPRRPT